MLLYLGRVLWIDGLFGLWLVAVGIVSFGAILVQRVRRFPEEPAIPLAGLPPISVLKPLKGLDEGMEENLEGFFRQDYPKMELIFSVSEAHDPAILAYVAPHGNMVATGQPRRVDYVCLRLSGPAIRASPYTDGSAFPQTMEDGS